jgi:energy-coupling factor transporter ATP-binding protein EcfA2
VAIARALAGRPEILLADEPTASLDRETGRGIVELIQKLAKQGGVTVVLVTHDSRILDVADRILALEDGRLSTLLASVVANTQRALHTLVQAIRKGELMRRLEGLDGDGFARLLAEATSETRSLLEVVDLVQGDAFDSMLEQVVGAFTAKVAGLLGAESATLSFADEAGEMRRSRGAAANASGGLSHSLADSQGRTFAVVEVAPRRDGRPFDANDERPLRELAGALAVILESWWRMSCACRAGGFGRTPACCEADVTSPTRIP